MKKLTSKSVQLVRNGRFGPLAALAAASLSVLFPTVVYAAEHAVDQKGKEFSVKTLTVKKGDVVVFQNSDSVTHNVFSKDDQIKFDLKTQKPGENSKVTFDKVGKGEVRCAIHPHMKIQLTVTE